MPPRGSGALTKVHYKGKEDDFIIFVDNAQIVKDWKKDRSIPLAQVVNGWKVFVTHKHGAQGVLDAASNSLLENEFGTSRDEDVVKQILERGEVQETEFAFFIRQTSYLKNGQLHNANIKHGDEDEDPVEWKEELVFRGRATRSSTKANKPISLPVRPKPSRSEDHATSNPARRQLQNEQRTGGIEHTSADASQSHTHSHSRTPSEDAASRKRKLPLRTTSSLPSDGTSGNGQEQSGPSTQDDEDAELNGQRRKRRSFGQDTSPSSKDPGDGTDTVTLPIRFHAKRNKNYGFW